MSVDLGRLKRALTLRVTRVDVGRWRVSGGKEPHIVTRAGCDCYDAGRGSAICKHEYAIALAVLDPAILAGLRALVGVTAGNGSRG